VNASEALGRMRALRIPVVTTADAAAVLGISISAASHTLRRLGAARLVTPVRKGLWALGDPPDPLALADWVTAPHPSYVSLQSALHLHGMIEQIPSMIYLVSLARTAPVLTGVGTFSVHHVRPEYFGGARQDPRTGVRLATPEKALVDFLYLSPTRSRLFAKLPELQLPKAFDRRAALGWAAPIPPGRTRTIVERELGRILGRAGRAAG
jgi:predicted transcriptional regulator of viral defense system